MGQVERRVSGIPDASVVAERANTSPCEFGGDVVAWTEGGFSEACFQCHAFLPATAALYAKLALCADEAEEGVGGECGSDGEGEGRVECAFDLCSEGCIERENVGAAKDVRKPTFKGLREREWTKRAMRGYLPHFPRRHRALWMTL